MNKGILTPLLILALSAMMVVPEAPSLLVHAAGPASLAVNPAVVGADVGETFTVSVDVGNVADMVATDVVLHYSNVVLSGVSIDCDGSTAYMGTSHIIAASSLSDSAMTAECAVALLGGSTLQVGAPVSVMKVTFSVIAFGSSDLTIDSSSTIAAEVSGSTVSVPYSATNGAFTTPPTILLVAPNGGPAPGQSVVKLHKTDHVDLQGFIQLSPIAPQAAFGGVVFTIVAPDTSSTTITSDIIFLSIGATGTVTATYTLPHLTGNYHVFVTPLRCTLPDQCTLSTTTAAGLSFRVKH